LKVGDLITLVDSEYSNTYTDTNKVSWINKLEQKIYAEHIKLQKEVSIDLVEDQAAYDLTGYDFEDILKVTVNGTQYELSSASMHEADTYYQSGNDAKITLDPVPDAAATAGLVIVHRYKPTLKTVAGKATEDLELADQYVDIYSYGLYAKISALRKEFGEYNNWMMLFNSELEDLLIKMGNTAPRDNREKQAKGKWGRW
jgi:hypothetical protein